MHCGYVLVVFVVLAAAVVGVMFVDNIDNYITVIICRPETNNILKKKTYSLQAFPKLPFENATSA